jgi:cytochrome c5
MPSMRDAHRNERRSRVRRHMTMTRLPTCTRLPSCTLLSVLIVLGACGRGGDRRGDSSHPTGQPAATAMVAASSEAAAKLAPPPSAALTARIAAEEQAAIARLPAGPGRDLVVGNCLICHAATMIEQQHKDTTAWNKTVTQMIAWGAPVPSDRRAELLTYLSTHFASTGGTPRAADPRVKS